jgi:hypothetical protein
MSGSDRRKYLSATTINQALLDDCHDNLEIRLEMICDIEAPDGSFIRVSDRNKYVGGVFYEARMKFPTIGRTVGEWLVGDIQFSSLSVDLSNVDGKFNKYLPGGNAFSGWIGRSVTVKLGLAEAAASYKTIFSGKVTEVGGIKRTTKTINLTARDDYDFLNDNLPTEVFSVAAGKYPEIEEAYQQKPIPIIYGDWTTSLDPDDAAVFAYPVNGNAFNVADPLGTRLPVKLKIASHALKEIQADHVYLSRGDIATVIPSNQIQNLSLSAASLEVKQGGTWLFESDGTTPLAYAFERGDIFLVRVKGKDLGAYQDNPVAQAQDLLTAFNPPAATTFHANWSAFKTKSDPTYPESSILNIKSRIWIGEFTPRLQYALSLLEQVRLEAFIDRDRSLKINSLQLDSWTDSPSAFSIKNWDVVKGSLEPGMDERNYFNRGQGAFDFRPNRNENAKLSAVLKNQPAIAQAKKSVAKKVVFPNLYDPTDVSRQFKEILKLSSSGFEHVACSLTWRSMLLEIGQFVRLNVAVGSTIFEDVPCMIREIGYDPEGFKAIVKMWSLQMVPFGTYQPGLQGTVGGSGAAITEE